MRDDLLGLTPDALAALANVGLVKRATKEIEAGKVPVLEEADDGTVVARFEDGVTTKLPRGRGLRDAPCSCPSTSVCRHRVALVLAYQRLNAGRALGSVGADAQPEVSTPVSVVSASVGAVSAQVSVAARPSPAAITDEALRAGLAPRIWDRASAARRSGYTAEVRRVDASVVLSTCTVRFLSGAELGFVRCDCAAGGGCEHVALAVWAFRAADERDPAIAHVVVEVGERKRDDVSAAWSGTSGLARDVLLEGATHLPGAIAGAFDRARERLVSERLAWPADVLDDLESELDAYRLRSARYSPEHLTELLAELAARERAGRRGGALPPSVVLGTDEAPETKLDHLRLISLGARLSAEGRERTADVLLCDPDTATILVLRRRFTYDEKETPEDGFALAGRSMSKGVRLGQLAAGQVVTTVARRRANRALLLGQGGVSRTTVTPQTGDWDVLPRQVRVESVDALSLALKERAPRLLRPRHLADGVVVVAVGSVESVAWSSGEQRLRARLVDRSGGAFELALSHRAVAPFAVDALAAALTATDSPVRFVSGTARRDATGIALTPIAVVTDRVIALDLAEGNATNAHVGSGSSEIPGVLADALAGAERALSSVAHIGLRHLPERYAADVGRARERAAEVGLSVLATRLDALRVAYEAYRVASSVASEDRVVAAWTDAAIRLSVLRETG